MSAVYAGVHRNGHPVAIKILHERLSADPVVERLFRREALVANTIQHPGVVPVTDDDVAEDGSTFLVMPLLSGENLRTRAARRGMILPLEEVLVVAHALLDVLQSAHAARIVHRDIKPDNVFMTEDGEVRVLDFGIARFFEANEAASVTRSGRAMGTPAFMAPEQALGRTREIDGQTDLWAVGATMFTLLSGRYVHPAESTNEMLVFAATRPPIPLSEVAPHVPKDICDVVDRALSFDKTRRWPGAGSMNEALRAACASALGKALSDLPIPAAPGSPATEPHNDATTVPPTPRALLTADTISPSATRRPAVGRRRAAFLALVFAFAMGAVAYVRVRGRVSADPPVTADTSLPTSDSSHNTEAQALLEAGLQLWKDASSAAARAKFAEAAQRDPGLAAAHLFFAATFEWPEPAARTHFAEARSLRSRLSSMQTMLLEALEPTIEEPPNYGLATRRLEALTEQFPNEDTGWIARAASAIHLREPERFHAMEDRVPGAMASWLRARAELQQDDLAAARKSLEACVAAAPQGAVDCLVARAKLEANEGACDDSALAARRLIAIDHNSPDGYTYLARAEFGRSHRTSAVRAILEEKWARSPQADRALDRYGDEFFLAVLDGEFDRAYAALDGWDKAVAASADGLERARPLIARFELDLELGRTEEAQRGARAFIEASQTWLPSAQHNQAVETTVALYRTGLIDRDEMLRRRARDEEGLIARGGYIAAPGTRWYVAYVEYVVTAEDAKLAVAHQPPVHPIYPAELREVNMDLSLGRMYLYAGQLELARTELRRGTRSCLFRKSMGRLQAHALYGDALAKAGRAREACDEYRVVLERWGGEPRSITARAARAASLRLGCAAAAAPNASTPRPDPPERP
ncbi:serine/threonine protein kinase [Pendulispora albinea]|uniref:Serine/threonine protein kinase n=2 Tax=Pendulispora albinea TaxID=2741071 RepID=A0ABZ2LIW8_9BACT